MGVTVSSVIEYAERGPPSHLTVLKQGLHHQLGDEQKCKDANRERLVLQMEGFRMKELICLCLLSISAIILNDGAMVNDTSIREISLESEAFSSKQIASVVQSKSAQIVSGRFHQHGDPVAT